MADRATFGGVEYVGVRLWLTAADYALLEQFWPDPDKQQDAMERGIKAEIARVQDKQEWQEDVKEHEDYLRMHTDDLAGKERER